MNGATRRAFVGGATGYTGRAVVTELTRAGVRTLAHVRPDSSRLTHWQARFAEAGAETDITPWVEDEMRRHLAQVRPTEIYALLGTTRARERSIHRAGGAAAGYEAVDYGLTVLLLRAAQAVSPAPRFIYLSSAGVRGGSRNAYIDARWRAEREIRASRVPFTIVRPSFITGPDRDEFRPMERVAAVVSDALLSVAGLFGGGRIRDRWRSITNTELARALVRLAADPAAAGRTVHAEELRG